MGNTADWNGEYSAILAPVTYSYCVKADWLRPYAPSHMTLAIPPPTSLPPKKNWYGPVGVRT